MGAVESILTEQEPSDERESPRHLPLPALRARPARRPRPPLTVATLHGIVIGLPSSGKKSLLRRLEGKELPNGLDECSSRISVPYHAPGKTWGERIHLAVDIPTNFEQEPDFCVVLVNPQHDPKSIKTYILKLLSMLFQTKASPISVCILVNFRDHQERSPPPLRRIAEEDVKMWVKEALVKCTHELGDLKTKPMIQTGVTSMKNCYGLDTLHHFIYQTYLNRKILMLEEQLNEVRLSFKESIKSNQRINYDKFLSILKPEEAHQASRRQSNSSQAEKQASNSSKQVAQQQNARRTFHAKPPTIELPPKGIDTKQALDDFFAEDDSDHENQHEPVLHISQSDDDDDDDDFYYDNDGHRTMGKGATETAIKAIPIQTAETKSNIKDETKSKMFLRGIGESNHKKVETKEEETANLSSINAHQNARTHTNLDGKELDDANSKISDPERNGWDDDDDLSNLDDEQDVLTTQTHPTVEKTAKSGANDESDVEVLTSTLDHNVAEHSTNSKEDYESHTSNVQITPNAIRLADAEMIADRHSSFLTVAEGAITEGDSSYHVHHRPDKPEANQPSSDKRADDRDGPDDEDIVDGNLGSDEKNRILVTPTQQQVISSETPGIDLPSDDDDDYMIGEAASHHTSNNAKKTRFDDSDDDEYVIGESQSNTQPKALSVVEDSFQKHDFSQTLTAPKPSTLSIAALAAIQQAQIEAQRLLATDDFTESSHRMKKLKTKKKKKGSDDKKSRRKTDSARKSQENSD